jgi:hypothetical protein
MDDKQWTLEEFLRKVYGWNDSCFMDDEDHLYGYSVRAMMETYADYKTGKLPS